MWALYVGVNVMNAWGTVRTDTFYEEMPLGFYKKPLNPRQFNYFEYRFRTVLLVLASEYPTLASEYIGKSTCSRFNLSGDVQVEIFQRYFNLMYTLPKLEIKKTTLSVNCKGLIKWAG